MTTHTAHHCTSTRLSRSSAAAFGTLFTAGLVQGAVLYAGRPADPGPHVAGTAAWWPHLALAAVTAVVAVSVYVHRRQAGRRGPVVLLPLGARAHRRVRRTLHEIRRRPARGVATAALVALILYGAFRIGLQFVAGLDPSFTVDAWGGPTYIGALAAHLLDAVALMSAAAWALDKIMLDEPFPIGHRVVTD
ncbi:hypothetical protein [Gordonia malaquae]|uniref:hypothetical protein n=1 Tax=Gordonia malaquae TaxID=410332 RepID=UPI0030FEB14F